MVKAKINKTVIAIEIIFVAFILGIIFSAFPDNSKDNIAIYKKRFKGFYTNENTYIYLLEENYDLRISGSLTPYVKYEKLKKVQEGEELTFLSRKNKRLDEYISSIFGHEVILELQSEEQGYILKIEDSIAEASSIPRLILKIAFICFFAALALVIMYSWVLLTLIYFNPDKYFGIDSILINYKIIYIKESGVPPRKPSD
jgi:hypothetical protein